jgi:hypothetical protein
MGNIINALNLFLKKEKKKAKSNNINIKIDMKITLKDVT